jgi:hypothetical protein
MDKDKSGGAADERGDPKDGKEDGNDIGEGSGTPSSEVGEAVDVDNVRDRAS